MLIQLSRIYRVLSHTPSPCVILYWFTKPNLYILLYSIMAYCQPLFEEKRGQKTSFLRGVIGGVLFTLGTIVISLAMTPLLFELLLLRFKFGLEVFNH